MKKNAFVPFMTIPDYLTLQLIVYDCPDFPQEQPACEPALASSTQELLKSAQMCANAIAREDSIANFPSCELNVLTEGPYQGLSLVHGKNMDILTSVYGDCRGYTLNSLTIGSLTGPWEFAPRIAEVSIRDASGIESSQSSDAPGSIDTWGTCLGNIDRGLTITLIDAIPIQHEQAVLRIRLPQKDRIDVDADLSRAWSRIYAGARIPVKQ